MTPEQLQILQPDIDQLCLVRLKMKTLQSTEPKPYTAISDLNTMIGELKDLIIYKLIQANEERVKRLIVLNEVNQN